jgi:hypothetical protein
MNMIAGLHGFYGFIRADRVNILYPHTVDATAFFFLTLSLSSSAL